MVSKEFEPMKPSMSRSLMVLADWYTQLHVFTLHYTAPCVCVVNFAIKCQIQVFINTILCYCVDLNMWKLCFDQAGCSSA